MRVHLIGMGVVGCFIARQLRRAGVPFSWWDTDPDLPKHLKGGAVELPARASHSPTAWHASTGAIYPDGSTEEAWQSYLSWTGVSAHALVEQGTWWFNHLHPPHKAKGAVVETIKAEGDPRAEAYRPPVRRTANPSMHLNVQSFVLMTRLTFGVHCRKTPPEGAVIVRTHGAESPRTQGYAWGWSLRAQLDVLEPELNALGRPAFYLLAAPYQTAYLLPIPGSPSWWYLGTHSHNAATARDYDVSPKLDQRLGFVSETLKDLVRVRSLHHTAVGWRPLGEGDHVEEIDGELVMRPMGSSGVRLAPAYTSALLHRLGVEPPAFNLGLY